MFGLRRTLLAVALVSLSLVLTPLAALADGMIIPNPIPNEPIVLPYPTVKYHHVDVRIENQVASTRVDQVFVNEANRQMEGSYVFPLPEEAAISGFAMLVDGKKLEGEVLERNKAREIYENIVRGRRDPALLEYVGRNLFRAQVFPIPARGERHVQIEYSQVLQLERGLVKYVYPLSTEKFSTRPLNDVAINVTVRARQAIKSVYSPSHEIAVTRKSDHEVVVSFERSNIKPDKDFELYYSLSDDEIGLSLLTYREQGQDGFFVLLVTPQAEVEGPVVAKDVIFVLDTSGSMKGEKLDQAKQALRSILDRLNENDRFNIISFNSTVGSFAERVQPASRREDGKRYASELEANGSTDINAALLAALANPDSERPQIVIFLTDGLPTVGVQQASQIIANAKKAAAASTRIFAFGVGYDVNTVLLDSVAQDNRGASEYVKPGANLEEAVSGFYGRVSLPVLTDISLDFGGVKVVDVYPKPLPDLFVGSQLAVVGRYTGSASGGNITLKGKVDGQTRTFTFQDNAFPGESRAQEFIPRLWATRKIGYLLNEIRLRGTNKELVDEVVTLSTRYGIITPYTSFLVQETDSFVSPEGQRKAQEQLNRAMATPAPAAGAPAVGASQQLNDMRSSQVAGGGGTATEKIVSVADKAFVLRDGVWTDTTYKKSDKTVKIGFGSDNYFEVLAKRPEWGRYFAVGEKVIVVLEGTAYEVTSGEQPPVQVRAAVTTTASSVVATATPTKPAPTATTTPVKPRPNVSPTAGVAPLPTPVPALPDDLPARLGLALSGLLGWLGQLFQ